MGLGLSFIDFLLMVNELYICSTRTVSKIVYYSDATYK